MPCVCVMLTKIKENMWFFKLQAIKVNTFHAMLYNSILFVYYLFSMLSDFCLSSSFIPDVL